MHLKVAAVGQKMPSWVNQGWNEYARRMPRTLALELLEVATEKRVKSGHAGQWKEREGKRLIAVTPPAAHVVALEVRGKAWSTELLAEKLQQWMSAGQDVVFLIGGPDGLSDECLARADQRWSLGPLTLPHPLVRIILGEQLYRAWSVVNQHPYHRA